MGTSRTTGAARGAPVVKNARRQVRKLRKAVRRGETLDALAAAARIYAVAIRPNLAAGRWPQAQAGCEYLLGRIPARQSPGYLPGLGGVIECLHLDAARAARAGGDVQGAKFHLLALTGCLRDRRAPIGQQVVALIDLARVCIDSDDPRAGGRMLATVGAFLAAGGAEHAPVTLSPGGGPADLWLRQSRPLVPSPRRPSD